MRDIDLVIGIKETLDYKNNFTTEQSNYIAETIDDILKIDGWIEIRKKDKESQLKKLTAFISECKKEAESPSLPFPQETKEIKEDIKLLTEGVVVTEEEIIEEPTANDFDEDLESKEAMIEQIVSYYEDIDPNIKPDEIRKDLAFRKDKEISKILDEITGNSEKKLNTEVSQKIYMRNRGKKKKGFSALQTIKNEIQKDKKNG